MYPDTYQNREDDEAVYWFSSPFDPLNNWSAHALDIDGLVFHTLEHAYHYKKFYDNWPEIAEQIRLSPSPWAAMKVARENNDKVTSNWHDIKLEVMEKLLRLKLEQNEDVGMILVKTGIRKIVENSPWDSFWGCGADGEGKNMMGELWMKIRDSAE
jgi:N-glycosidase YbiA